jgi:hypothetical protein
MRRGVGQHSFWVAKTDFGRVADAVQRAWPEIADDGKVPPSDRFALWQLTFALELQATLRLMKVEPHVDAARRFGVQIAKIFTEESIDSAELHYAIHLSTSGPYRGMSLAGYTLQLARLMGVTDRDCLEQIAVGALVHDIGARNLPVDPAALYNKWTAEERDLVERHPQRSYEELLPSKLSYGQMMMAYQHHERMDGEGYPVEIPGEEIHPWAKMLAIADRFEALTTGRAYRRPFDLAGAVGQLNEDIKGHLDPEMTQCWIKSLPAT